MTDFDDRFGRGREPQFYLPRLLGAKLAILVVVLVLYLCIRHQLITHLSATVVNFGLAHAEANVTLAVFGFSDTVTTFTLGRKTYNLTRFTIANADLFAQCWRVVLWQIERGTISAVLLIFAPPVVWFTARTIWEVRKIPDPAPRPARPLQAQASRAELVPLAAPSSPPAHSYTQPIVELVEELVPANISAETDEQPLPIVVVRKRVRKEKKPDDTPDEPPPAASLVQPGQIRKRPKPEA